MLPQNLRGAMYLMVHGGVLTRPPIYLYAFVSRALQVYKESQQRIRYMLTVKC